MKQKPLILVVEDEFSIAEVIVAYLQQAGFATHHLDNGLPVIEFLRNHSPALIVLDLMLPDTDGITLCKQIRQDSSVPIIMATARVDEIDRLLGLELGADDYICKPYSPRELVARVRAVLRRYSPSENRLASGTLQLDADSYMATLQGKPLALTPREFQLLQLFVEHPHKVYSREQILQQLYQDEYVSDRAIDSHIKNLRKKLQLGDGDEKEWVRSVYGVGYQFVGQA